MPRRLHLRRLHHAGFALLAFLTLSISGEAQDMPVRNARADSVVASLGRLADHLVLALSMDGDDHGGMVFSRLPVPPTVEAFGNLQYNNAEGRQSMGFSGPSSGLALVGGANLGVNYTLSTWMKVPTFENELNLRELPLHLQRQLPQDRSRAIPRSQRVGDSILRPWIGVDFAIILDEKCGFSLYRKTANGGGLNPLTTAIPAGWHHVALVGNDTTTTLYLDGEFNCTRQFSIDAAVTSINGYPSQKAPAGNGNAPFDQYGQLDDMLFFDRALSSAEVRTLSSVRLPTKEPANGSLPPAEAADLVKTYGNSLVFVTGEGAGSGFIANMGGKPFLLTNAHVAAGVRGASIQPLQGPAAKLGAASVAVGHDIFGIQATTTGQPFEVMRDVENNTAIGDRVVVLGNAEGGGVINNIMGKIVGIGPQLVEVDAPFQPGNSGSPILHLKSTKVIGVATYLTIRKYDSATKQPIKDPVIRRFGYRIDSVKTWQPVDWNAFFSQAAEIEKIEQLTKDLIAFIKDISEDGKVSSWHVNPVIRTRVETWLASKSKNPSPKDLAAANQNFLSFLKVTSQSDITSARARLTYDYFQRQLNDHQRDRTEISNIFSKIIEGIGHER